MPNVIQIKLEYSILDPLILKETNSLVPQKLKYNFKNCMYHITWAYMWFSSDSKKNKQPTHQDKADVSTDPSPWFLFLERERKKSLTCAQHKMMLTWFWPLAIYCWLLKGKLGLKLLMLIHFFNEVPGKVCVWIKLDWCNHWNNDCPWM